MTTTAHHADLDGSRVFYRRSGSADRLLVLLHGWPQTGHCWRHLIEPLAEDFTVVAPDLRGYGGSRVGSGGVESGGAGSGDVESGGAESGGAESDGAGSGRAGSGVAGSGVGYEKRDAAADLARLVAHLGFSTASVVGHDRGARVAHRWALDRPADIDRLALLDVLPTREVMNGFDRHSAAAMWHWFFHLQPDLPELLIAGNVEAYLRFFFERQSFVPDAIDAEATAEYVRAFSDPAVLHASLEDYRAGFREDLAADEEDHRAGRVVTAPLLVLWGARGGLGASPVREVWSRYAASVTGAAIEDCKHFLPEEQPGQVLRHLRGFLADGS